MKLRRSSNERNSAAKTGFLIRWKIELDEPIYEVEKIVKRKKIRGEDRFLIRWKGYDKGSDTWEPRENLQPRLVQTYLDSLARN